MNDDSEMHLWILKAGTVINYQGIAYKLRKDTEILGNTPIPKVFQHPSNDVLRQFFNDNEL